MEVFGEDGSLNFTATLDTRDLKEEANEVKDSLLELSKATTESFTKTGQEIKESFDLVVNQTMQNILGIKGNLDVVSQAEKDLLKQQIEAQKYYASQGSFEKPKIRTTSIEDILGTGFASTFEKARSAFNSLDSESQEFITRLTQLRIELSNVEGAQELLNKQNEEGSVSAKDYASAIAILNSQQKILKESIQAATQAQKEYDASSNLIAGSISQKNGQIKTLKDALINENDVVKVKEYNSQIQALEIEVKQLKNIGKTGFDDFGNPIKKELDTVATAATATTSKTNLLSKSFGFVRQAAYLIPGIGIAGIFDLITQGVVALVKSLTDGGNALNKFKDTWKALNDVVAEGNKNAGSQIADLKILYSIATNVNNSMADRLNAVKALKQEFPDYFAKLNDEIILNGQSKKSYDDLTTSIIKSSRAAAAKAKIDDIERQKLDIDFQKQKINTATANEKARAQDRNIIISSGSSFGGGTGGSELLQTKAEQQAIIEQRRLKAIGEQEAKETALNYQEKFLVAFAGENAIAKVVEDANDKKDRSNKKVRDNDKGYNELLTNRLSLEQQIQRLEAGSFQSGLTKELSEIDKINEKYNEAIDTITAFNEKAEAFNKTHSKQIQLIPQTEIDSLKQAQSTEVLNAQYKQDAANYIASLDDKKRAFEELKKIQDEGNAGVTAFAEQTYKEQLNGFTSYIDYLKKQAAGIQIEIALNGSNVGLQQSLTALNKKIVEEQNKINKDADEQKVKDYTSALQDAITFNDKREQLEKKYNKDVQAILSNADDEQQAEHLANLKQAHEQELTDLQNNILRQSDLYKQLNEDIISFTRKQLKDRIDTLKKELEQGFFIDDKGQQIKLTPQMQQDIQSAVDGAQNLYTSTDKTVENLNKIADKSNEIGSALNSLASALQPLNSGLSDTIKIIAQLSGELGQAAKSFQDFKKAQENDDTAGKISAGIGIASAAVGVVSTIVNFFSAAKKSKKEADAQLQQYNDSLLSSAIQYNELIRQRARDQQDINNLTLQELKTRQQMLDVQKEQAQQDFNALLSQIQAQGQQITGEHEEKFGGFLGIARKTKTVQDLAGLSNADFDQLEKLYTENKLTDETKAWFEQLKQVHDELDSIGQSASELQDQMNQALTGTTADDIANTIIQGLASGKTAVEDFANDFHDLVKNAILQAVKYQALQQPIQDLYNQLAADAGSDNVLTQTEIQDLQNKYNAIIQNANDQFKQLQDITNIDFASTDNPNANSLTGAVKNITEQSAELLAGQFGAQRLTMVSILQNATQQLQQQILIATYCADIPNIKSILRDMQTNGIRIR